MMTLRLLPMALVASLLGVMYAHAAAPTAATPAPTIAVDCSAVYGKPASCEQVPCGPIYSTFLGTWSGQFWAYERKKSTQADAVYRPYRNTVAYSEGDCLKNGQNGEVFIVGHQTDDYAAFQDLPAKTDKGLLVTGRKADGTPFLRTIGSEGSYDYSLVYRNPAAKFAVWRLSIPAAGNNPAMTFTTIDGRDFGAAGETRDVTVTLTVGPAETPYWEGVIAHGSHTKR